MENIEWKRNCPKCGIEVKYLDKQVKIRADKENRCCRSCMNKGKIRSNKTRVKMSKAKQGENNPHYGISNYDIWLEKYGKEEADKLEEMRKIKISKGHIGLVPSEETRKKLSDSHKGQKSWNKGKTEVYSRETRKKMRLSRIKYIESLNGQISPNYNSSAIPIIEQKAEELKITDLQHAENGGEFHIKELGYWVDGYSKKKNIVIEYYEPFHERQKERDERRKQEIINHLGCKFIEIKNKR